MEERETRTEDVPLMATYTGLSGSDPSYALSASCVNGSSLGGSKSSRGACMIVLMVVAVVALVQWRLSVAASSRLPVRVYLDRQ